MQINSAPDALPAISQVNASEPAQGTQRLDPDEQKQPSSQENRNESRGPLEAINKWSTAAELTRQLSEYEHTEQVIIALYRTIEQLKRELSKASAPQIHTSEIQPTQTLIKEVQRKFKFSSNGLSSNFELTHGQSAQLVAEMPSQIDLITPKSHTERLQITLGGTGTAVRVHLEAYQSAEQNLKSIQEAFERTGIQVNYTSQNRLQFSMPQEHSRALQETWSVQGEGVRIAAGIPMNVQLHPSQGAVHRLAKSVQEGQSRDACQTEVQAAQTKLKEALAQLRAKQQELRLHLNALQTLDRDRLRYEQLSTQVNQHLQHSPTHQFDLIMLQAGSTVSLVEYSLANN